MGTVRNVQGAKEQAMVNIAIDKEHGNKLKNMWIDVKKAYDSVDHKHLLACMNREKSATNCTGCESDAVVLEGHQGYKYLGITEDASCIVKRETFEKVRKEILCRVEKLCMTKLNGKNMIRAINEHAISVINYHVGLVKLEPSDFKSLDHDIRQ
ncbi:hypothetical protein NAPIS_ORF01136, partial [Vairimorpha apis BRL 01]